MPLPFILGGAAAAAGIAGVAKGIKGAIDTKEAKDIQNSIEYEYNEAQEKIRIQREKTDKAIQELGKLKMDVYAHEVNEFVELYSKAKKINLTDHTAGLQEISNINISEDMLKNIQDTALEAKEILGDGVAGLSAGVLLGWGTYGSVMALGTASTGAAIGGLSGAAATNATLAWLGGGAIAAGGGGIALGTTILGGIVAGPALLVAGALFSAKAKENLDNAYSNLAQVREWEEQIEVACDKLHIIEKNVYQIYGLIFKLAKVQKKANLEFEKVLRRQTDPGKMTRNELNTMKAVTETIKLIKVLIDTPLLTEDGMLTKDIFSVQERKDVRKTAQTVNSSISGKIQFFANMEEKYEYAVGRYCQGYLEEAVPLLKQVAEEYPCVYGMLYYAYLDGFSKEEQADEKQALFYLEKGCCAQDPMSCVLYGLFYTDDEHDKQMIFEEYYPALEKLADDRDFFALYVQGIYVMNPTDREANPEESVWLFRKSLELGFYRAAYSLMVRYEIGSGVEQSDEDAVIYGFDAIEYPYHKAYTKLAKLIESSNLKVIAPNIPELVWNYIDEHPSAQIANYVTDDGCSIDDWRDISSCSDIASRLKKQACEYGAFTTNLSGIQIFRQLPKKNCKKCGSPTCMAFAMKVASGDISLKMCPYM